MLHDPPQRLADVISPVAVLGAWLAGGWLTVASPHPRPWSLIFRRLTLASVFIATVWSIATQARFVNRLDDADVFMGPRAAWAALEDTYRRLHLRPIDDWAPPGRSRGIQLLGRYVLRCTSPDDRLLVAGQFAPQIYFYTERAFAGGQVHFMAGWHDTVQDQRLTLERLVHERVPIALIGDEEATFRRRFSLVAEYVDGHYVEVPFARGNGSWRVLVERDRVPAGTDAELGLPCYVPRAGA
jgi:hypothetical protein